MRFKNSPDEAVDSAPGALAPDPRQGGMATLGTASPAGAELGNGLKWRGICAVLSRGRVSTSFDYVPTHNRVPLEKAPLGRRVKAAQGRFPQTKAGKNREK